VELCRGHGARRFRAYNFHEIRTPIFESTELFARGVGEETDIVSKEMFTWKIGRVRVSAGVLTRAANLAGASAADLETVRVLATVRVTAEVVVRC